MIRNRRSGRYRNLGILFLRIGLGIMFILHGYPKVLGGPDTWISFGSATQYIGLDFAPMFFGFMAGITELFGGIFLILGLFFTPSTILLLIVMLVATAKNVGTGASFTGLAHSIELAIVFFGLIFIGPGKYSLDRRLKMRRR